jgi:hyaluronoglucosaminidase
VRSSGIATLPTSQPAPQRRGSAPWLGALEGYYGPPLDVEARAELVRWLAAHGYDAYVYAPKDDPYQRARWRDPYLPGARAQLESLVATCEEAGLVLALTISPGLDWRVGDPAEVDALTAKVTQLLDLGAGAIGVAWDDVAGTGTTVGAAHGAAVAEVRRRLDRPGLRWSSCPIDYAVEEATPYLLAFAEHLGEGVDLIWTGPSVVTARLTAAHVRMVQRQLGRPLLFAENFPVNDMGMAGQLHLGPYPDREPEAMQLVGGAIVNFMSLPLASRIGLDVAARAWRDPFADREAAWREAVAEVGGLGPLARACRAWLDQPGPDPTLAAWAEAAGAGDARLRSYLEAGCRAGLPPGWAAEVEPWLLAWEQEAGVMRAALDLLEGSPATLEAVTMLALAWRAARRQNHQTFGTRFAVYPSTVRDGGNFLARPDAVVAGENLTDVVVRRALAARWVDQTLVSSAGTFGSAGAPGPSEPPSPPGGASTA